MRRSNPYVDTKIIKNDQDRPSYDRVTSIIGAFTDWSKIPEDVLERKKDIGTCTHRIIELMLQGKELGVIPEDIEGYIESFDRFWTDYSHNFDESTMRLEERLWCDNHKITGKPDMIIKKNDKTFILDWKTSAGMYSSYDLQAAAYCYLAIESGYSNVDQPMFIRLRIDGKKPALTKFSNFESSLEMFFKCLDVYRYFKMNK